MTLLLLLFTAVETMEVVLHEVSGETDTVCCMTAKLQFVHDSDSLLCPHRGRCFWNL